MTHRILMVHRGRQSALEESGGRRSTDAAPESWAAVGAFLE
jgi:hypothetical protein